jgi:hypothetical protein
MVSSAASRAANVVQPAPLDHPLRAGTHVLGKGPLQAAHRQLSQPGHLADPGDLAVPEMDSTTSASCCAV